MPASAAANLIAPYLTPVSEPSRKPALVATTKAEHGGGFYISGEGTEDK